MGLFVASPVRPRLSGDAPKVTCHGTPLVHVLKLPHACGTERRCSPTRRISSRSPLVGAVSVPPAHGQ